MRYYKMRYIFEKEMWLVCEYSRFKLNVCYHEKPTMQDLHKVVYAENYKEARKMCIEATNLKDIREIKK